MSKCPGCTVSDISKTLLAYVNTGIRWREDYRLKAKLLFPLVLVLMMIKHWDYGIDEVMVQCICSKEAMRAYDMFQCSLYKDVCECVVRDYPGFSTAGVCKPFHAKDLQI